MTEKTTKPKKVAKPRTPRVSKTAVAVSESPQPVQETGMMAFHKADRLARTIYPQRVWDTEEVLRQLSTGIIYAMNLYNVGYLGGLEIVKAAATESLQAAAVHYALGNFDEERLATANHQTLASADIVGMPLSPRAAFCRSQKDLQQQAMLIRRELGATGRPLTMNDVETYFYATYFSMTPVAIFKSDPASDSDIARRVIQDITTGSHLTFVTTPGLVVLDPKPEVVNHPAWKVCERLLALISAIDIDPSTALEMDDDLTEMFNRLNPGLSADQNLETIASYLISHVGTGLK